MHKLQQFNINVLINDRTRNNFIIKQCVCDPYHIIMLIFHLNNVNSIILIVVFFIELDLTLELCLVQRRQVYFK
ncbi:unnamed protein product [Paramecium sonneborni]|uniref:Uncharacterized protein n=1 Tax=Paramecium sonneborni TaxID=65129 RepID=A0A8S1LDM7_9CILI|nr:unnamed protein product [Paramecium sonneborni]